MMIRRHKKCDREALRGHGAALNNDEDALKGQWEAIKGDKVVKVRQDTLKKANKH